MAEKKPTFYMMVGVPGSGKTTYARQIPNATVLSSDDIRAEIGADGGDKKMHHKVFDILHERTKEALSAGNDVVYDATNLRHTRRADLLNEIKRLAGRKVCVYFAIPLEQALSQNTDRDTPVPEEVIKRMNLELCEPRIDEGWDEIKVIRILPERRIDSIRKMTVKEYAEFVFNNRIMQGMITGLTKIDMTTEDLFVQRYSDWLNSPGEVNYVF